MSTAFSATRVHYPADPMLPRLAAIQSIQPEACGVSTFWMAFADPEERAAFRFQPGMFNMVYLPGVG